MTKKQKIWLVVSLAMFLVPEILWGGVRWIIFNVFLPIKNNSWIKSGLFPDVDNGLLGVVISQTQFIGLVIFLFLFLKLKINKSLKIALALLLILLLFFSGILAWMGLYNLNNSPQIG